MMSGLALVAIAGALEGGGLLLPNEIGHRIGPLCAESAIQHAVKLFVLEELYHFVPRDEGSSGLGKSSGRNYHSFVGVPLGHDPPQLPHRQDTDGFRVALALNQ